MPQSGSYFYPQVQSQASSYPFVAVREIPVPTTGAVGKLYMSASALYFASPTDGHLKLVGAATVGTNDLILSSSTSTIFISGNLVVEGSMQFDGDAHFGTEINNGNSGASATIDWTNSLKQRIYLSNNCVFTFTAPGGACNLMFNVIQDDTGSRTVTWPAAVWWPAGTAPTLSTASGSNDLISFYYDGTNYHGQSSLNSSGSV